MQSMEVEITREWKEKCERLQAAAHEKLQREQQEWESERQSFENRINEYEKKVHLSALFMNFKLSFSFNFYKRKQGFY